MAEHNIKFTLGSTFKGEGYQKATKAIKDVNSNVRQSAELISSFASAFGGMDTKAAQAAKAISGFAQVAASGNIVAMATQGAMLALSFAMDKLRERAKAAREQYEAIVKAQEAAFNSELAGRIEALQGRLQHIAHDFETVAKQAAAMTAAINGLEASRDQGGIIALETQKLNELLAAHSEAERQAIEQTYALKIAVERAAVVQAQGADKVDAATTAFSDCLTRQQIAAEQLAAVTQTRVELEKKRATLDENEKKQRETIDKEIAELKKQEVGLLQRQTQLQKEREILDVQLQKAKQDAANAEASALNQVKQVELKNKELAEQLANRKGAEDGARASAESKTAADNELAEKVKSAAQIQAEVNTAAANLKAAQQEYEAKLREWNDPANLAKYAARQSVGTGNDLKRGVLDDKTQKTIQDIYANQKVSDAIASGGITSVKEASRLEREAMREARDAISANQAQAIKEEQRYQRIKQMGDRAKSEQDKKFEKQYEQIKGKQDKSLSELGNAKSSMDRAADDLADIKAKLEDLGLK